jgi:adenine-specific DNA-methyltransferase
MSDGRGCTAVCRFFVYALLIVAVGGSASRSKHSGVRLDNSQARKPVLNLFLVFGEPDVVIEKQKDGKLVAEVRGVDVFDPTTGEIRSSGPEDIACWFLDTDYDGESFFVRHAYFLGGLEPYEKLKRALRAEVDEAEWSRLYTNRSVPFSPPVRGKVAVKVINHYGDEVLKVYSAGK